MSVSLVLLQCLCFIVNCMCLQGFSSAMSGFVKLGLINTEPCPLLGHTASPVSWVWIYRPFSIQLIKCLFFFYENIYYKYKTIMIYTFICKWHFVLFTERASVQADWLVHVCEQQCL